MRSFKQLVLAVAIVNAPAALAQGYTLTGARLGTASTITMTIPKDGNAQTALTLQLSFTGGNGANCSTGSLADYWSPSGSRAPAGVTMGYSGGPMGLPSNSMRTFAINVASSAKPMSRQYTLVVPRGSCGGSNQTSTITLNLVNPPPPPPPPKPKPGVGNRSQFP